MYYLSLVTSQLGYDIDLLTYGEGADVAIPGVKIEDSCLEKADAIITICPDLADYVNGLLNSPAKHFLIENSIFDPIKLAGQASTENPAQSTEQTANLPKHARYIVYAGTLEPYQGIDILIPAFRIFFDNHPDFTLLIVGGASRQVEKYSELAHNWSKELQETGVPEAIGEVFTIGG